MKEKTGIVDRKGREMEQGDIVLMGNQRGRGAVLYSVQWDATKDTWALDDVVWNGKSVGAYFRLEDLATGLEVVGKLL